ncbi:hypothetical protein DB345_08380 [Spartobacteria bacterium LR76]|nr:hypothetical protein DB345_08380 [Spartobacteria bacterium LR76]
MTSFFSRLFGRKPTYEIADIYRSLRAQIFALPTIMGDRPEARLGVVLETGLPDACYTLVATCEYSASLYLSNGGGFIGAGEHPEGAAAAKEFLEFAANFESQLKPTRTYPLPTPGRTRFYIIRKDGILTGEFSEDDLGNDRLPLSPLFFKGHDLITIIRQVDERSSQSPTITE